MSVHFNESPNDTVGVELELLLIDPNTQIPIAASPRIIESLHPKGHHRIKSEFNCSTVEIESEISEDIPSCRTSLEQELQALSTLGQQEGFTLLSSSTHPFTPWTDMQHYPGERYETILERMQILARRVHVYRLHVHIGLSSGEQALNIVNTALAYLPHLLALSANSPFWNGIDTGLQSYRYAIMDSLPYSGCPPPLYRLVRIFHLFQHFKRAPNHLENERSLLAYTPEP